MIFLPNKFERYIASFRLYIQLSALKNGINSKILHQMRKINIAQALISQNEKTPENVALLSRSLLDSAVLVLAKKGKILNISITGSGVYLVNRRLFIALLMLLSGKTDKISISFISSGIILKSHGCYFSRNNKILKALNCLAFSELNTNMSIIIIPAEQTSEIPTETYNAWQYISDGFSPVNIYLENTVDDYY